jgi:hypothetical protein
MTPLEKARERAKNPEPPACKDCPKSERVENLLYCQVSGKIIMPQYENISCCRGDRLKIVPAPKLSFEEFKAELGNPRGISEQDLRAMYEAYIDDEAEDS